MVLPFLLPTLDDCRLKGATEIRFIDLRLTGRKLGTGRWNNERVLPTPRRGSLVVDRVIAGPTPCNVPGNPVLSWGAPRDAKTVMSGK